MTKVFGLSFGVGIIVLFLLVAPTINFMGIEYNIRAGYNGVVYST